MVSVLLAVIGVLILIVGVLLVKIHYLHKAAGEIAEGFAHRLAEDTNTLIDISSRDFSLRRLASSINAQLRILREQRHRYLSGDRELKEAVTNISHDLRTPLTAICGYMDLMEQEALPDPARRYLRLIRNRVDAMTQLTDELFQYSVILSAQELPLETVYVNGALEESIAAFYAALTERGIRPDIQLTERRIERRLNREALGRVFSNILNNALKYSKGDLEIRLLDSGEIRFSNTASGLNEVLVGKLFDRFFTVESGRNATGLGLSISKALVEQMGGTIAAEYDNRRLCISVWFPEKEA